MDVSGENPGTVTFACVPSPYLVSTVVCRTVLASNLKVAVLGALWQPASPNQWSYTALHVRGMSAPPLSVQILRASHDWPFKATKLLDLRIDPRSSKV